MAKVTLDRLDQKIDGLIDKVDALQRTFATHTGDDAAMYKDIRESLDGCDEYPGVRGRLDRLEQSKKRNERLISGLYVALCSAAVAYGFTFLPK